MSQSFCAGASVSTFNLIGHQYALIESSSPLKCGELGKALGLEGIQLRNEMRHILDDLSADCVARGERSLAALVVNQATGAPGQGWKDGEKPWHAEVQAVFRQWAS